MAGAVPLDDLPDTLRGTAVPEEDMPGAAAPAPRKRLTGGAAADFGAGTYDVKTGAAAIPGVDQQWLAGQSPAQQQRAKPDWVSQFINEVKDAGGTAEALASAVSGSTLGFAGGILNQINNVGAHGLRMALGQETKSLPTAEESFSAGAAPFTYQPRGEAGQAKVEALGHANLASLLGLGTMGSLSRPQPGAVPQGAAVAKSAARDKVMAPIETMTGAHAERTAESLKSEMASRVDQQALASSRAAANVAQDAQVKAKARAAAVEQDALDSGAPVAEAKREADTALRRVTAADVAASALEAELFKRPRMGREAFGERLRGTVQMISDKLTAKRSEEVQFGKVIDAAGDTPNVPTDSTLAIVKKHLEDVRNPQLKSTLEQVAGLLKTKAEEAPASSGLVDAAGNLLTPPAEAANQNVLTLKAVDSLRKYLDNVTTNKAISVEGKAMAVDKETLHVIREIKRDLTANATETVPAYREALSKFSTLSRPLDIVERNGALRKVLERDPVSTDYAMTEADVVGHIINKSNRGSPAIKWIMKDSPQIKEPARLYFTQELFGTDVAPTPTALRNFLKKNESALNQLGLYSEFKDIRTARETAQHAVTTAKEGMRAVGDAVTSAEAQQQVAVGQASEARGTARQATDALAKQKQVTQHYETFMTELAHTAPRDAGAKIQTLGRKMIDDGYLSNAQYEALIKQARIVEEHYADTSRMRKSALIIGGILGLGYGGKEIVRHAF